MKKSLFSSLKVTFAAFFCYALLFACVSCKDSIVDITAINSTDFNVPLDAETSIDTDFDGLSFYPINQFTTPDKWKKLASFEEMREAVEVDSTSLAKLDTKRLMQVCFEYPLLLNYYCHNDKVAGLESICNSFAGFRILKTREDYRENLSTFIACFEHSIQSLSEAGNRNYPRLLAEAVNILLYGQFYLTKSGYLYTPCLTHSIETPYGQTVYHFHRAEADPEKIEESNRYYITSYPNATFVSTSTTSYNCHSYAWNMSHGGITSWINRFEPTSSVSSEDNLSKYWTNDRYIAVSASSSTMSVIYYPLSDHSARKYSSTLYISKWGDAPLMKHAPGYGPYSNMNNRQYYGTRPYQLSGDEFIYDNSPINSHVYTVQDIPSWMGHTTSWMVLNGRGEEEDCIITTYGDSFQ